MKRVNHVNRSSFFIKFHLYFSKPSNMKVVVVRNFVIGTQTCLDIFQGRVTAPRSHPVISMDLLMTSKLISSYLFSSLQLKWFWHRTVLFSTMVETWELLCVLRLSSWSLQTEHTQRTWFCALQCKETVKDTENVKRRKNTFQDSFH